MLSIFRFNWPFYLVATLIFPAAMVGLVCSEIFWVKVLMALAAVGSGYFILVSLGVSHLVYDRSDLYCWRWVDRAFNGAKRQKMILCHAGFDEVSAALRERMGGMEWQVLDHYDPVLMPEASIRRARAQYPPTPNTVAADHDSWPVEGGRADIIFGIMAIHELRTVDERAAWFREAKRSLGRDGRVVIVEHVRDMANFVAFGPGFLHFHSVRSWELSWKFAELGLTDSFRITPWVRVFVLKHV